MLRISHAKELSKSLRFVDGFTPRKVIGGKGGNSGIVDGTPLFVAGEVDLLRLKTFSKIDGRR